MFRRGDTRALLTFPLFLFSLSSPFFFFSFHSFVCDILISAAPFDGPVLIECYDTPVRMCVCVCMLIHTYPIYYFHIIGDKLLQFDRSQYFFAIASDTLRDSVVWTDEEERRR